MSRAASTMEIFQQPGEHFVGDADFRVRTLLGSCVSVTLWHPAKKYGAMSHFLLGSRKDQPDGPADGRYGDEAMRLMIGELRQAGIEPRECEAKIFGGGDMFPMHKRMSALNVGQKNGEAAKNLLRSYGIPLVSESLYGTGHRQVIFDISNGHVWSRQIKPVAPVLPGAPAIRDMRMAA